MIIHSTFHHSYLWLPLIGLIIGLIATMIGGSGGSIFPPILILFFHIPPQIAVATSLAAALPIGFVGTLGHQRKGNIQFQTALVFIITGFAGAMAGTYVSRLISGELLTIILGAYFIVLGIFLFYSLNKQDDSIGYNGTLVVLRKRFFTGSTFGFLAGSATGLFGTSGTAPVLAGLFSLKLPVRVIAGTSLLVVFTNTFSGFTGHFIAGQIDMTLVYLLASGSILGSIAGPVLLGNMNLDKVDSRIQKPRLVLKISITAVFIVFGLLLIFK